MKARFFFTSILVLAVVAVSNTLKSQETQNVENNRRDSSISIAQKYKNKIIHVRGDKQFPPFEFINSEGKADGFDVELFDLLMKRLGIKYELQLCDFVVAIKQLSNNEIDAIPGIFYSTERAKSMFFGIPHNILSYKIVSRKERNYNSLGDLKKMRVVVQNGDRANNFLSEQVAQGKMDSSNLYRANTILEGLHGVDEGKYDFMLLYDITANYYVDKFKFKNLVVNNIDIPAERYSIAVSKDNQELIYLLNMALYEAKADGSYDKLYDKWFGVYTPQRIPAVFLTVLFIIVGLFIFAIGLTIFLRYRIKRATKDMNKSNNNLSLALEAGNMSVWQYDISQRSFHSLNGVLPNLIDRTFEELLEAINQDDRENFAD